MICPFCESQIEDGLTLCPHCNAKIQQIPAAPETELTREDAPEAQEIPEAPAAPEAQAAAPVIPEPLWNPEPEAEAAASEAEAAVPEASLPQPEPPQEAAPVAERKRSPKRGLLIGLGCAALAAVVGLGIWFLGRRNTPTARLQKAAGNSLQALEDYAHRLPNLGAMLDKLKALETGQTAHEELQLTVDSSINGAEPEKIAFQLDLDGDKAAGLVGGQFSLTVPGQNLDMQFYGDKTQVQLASEALLEDQVLALPLENLPQRWNKSALGKFSGLTLPEEGLKLQEYSPEALEKVMTEHYGQDWTLFKESLRVEEYQGTPHFTEGVSYTLVWDQRALDAIHEKSAKVLEAMETMNSTAQLLQMDKMGLLGDLGLEALWQFSSQCEDLQLLVEKELLTGLYVAEKEGEGWLELRLQGEENPWTHCTAALQMKPGSTLVTKLLDLTMEQTEDQLTVTVKNSIRDQEGKEYEATEGPFTLIYRDSDGSLRLDGVETDEALDLRLYIKPAEAGIRLDCEITQQMEFYDGYSVEDVIRINTLVTGKLTKTPAPFSASPTDLLSLSESKLEELLQNSVGKLLGPSSSYRRRVE